MSDAQVYKRYGYPPPLQGYGMWRFHHTAILQGTPVGRQAPHQQRVYVDPCMRMTTKDAPSLLLSRPVMRNYFVQIPKDVYPGEIIRVMLDEDEVLLQCPAIRQPFETVIVTILGNLSQPALPGSVVKEEEIAAAKGREAGETGLEASMAAISTASASSLYPTSVIETDPPRPPQAVPTNAPPPLAPSGTAPVPIAASTSSLTTASTSSPPIPSVPMSMSAPPAPVAPAPITTSVPAAPLPPPAPLAPVSVPPQASGPSCPACTYINSPGAYKCELCQTQLSPPQNHRPPATAPTAPAPYCQPQQQPMYQQTPAGYPTPQRTAPASYSQSQQQPMYQQIPAGYPTPQHQPQYQQQPHVQPVIQAPVTTQVQLVIPPNAQPGGTITFRTPKGNMSQITIPQGVVPGSTLTISITE